MDDALTNLEKYIPAKQAAKAAGSASLNTFQPLNTGLTPEQEWVLIIALTSNNKFHLTADTAPDHSIHYDSSRNTISCVNALSKKATVPFGADHLNRLTGEQLITTMNLVMGGKEEKFRQAIIKQIAEDYETEYNFIRGRILEVRADDVSSIVANSFISALPPEVIDPKMIANEGLTVEQNLLLIALFCKKKQASKDWVMIFNKSKTRL